MDYTRHALQAQHWTWKPWQRMRPFQKHKGILHHMIKGYIIYIEDYKGFGCNDFILSVRRCFCPILSKAWLTEAWKTRKNKMNLLIHSRIFPLIICPHIPTKCIWNFPKSSDHLAQIHGSLKTHPGTHPIIFFGNEPSYYHSYILCGFTRRNMKTPKLLTHKAFDQAIDDRL